MPNPLSVLNVEQLGQLPPLQNLSGTPLIARGLNVLFGPSGSFKSFYMLDQSLTIAQTAPVVYVAAEGSSGLHKRVMAWTKHYQRTAGQLYFVCEEVNLRDWATVQRFMDAVGAIKPALVVFDTLARCIVGGEENSAKDIGVAIYHCALTQRTLKTAVALVHHTTKSEKSERGSGAIRGAADAMIEMAPTADGAVRVSCSKLKDDEPWEPNEYRFSQVNDSGILLPSHETEFLSHKLTPTELQVLEFLALDVFETCGATSRQIMEALNIQDRHVYRLLSHLKREMSVAQDSKGDPYLLTAKGRKLVCRQVTKKAQLISLVPAIISENN
jgi:hypothetical protein